MIGLFQENGPCSIDSDGNVQNNVYSWTEASNMIFIDQVRIIQILPVFSILAVKACQILVYIV